VSEEDGMSEVRIPTVTGSIAPAELGRTLVHEHVVTGLPGWESDTVSPGYTRRELLARASDRIAELRAEGIGAIVDPCPADLGRDVELSAELSQRTGFPIIAATGLYNEAAGAATYWKFRTARGDAAKILADTFIHELTKGIGSTGIRPGIIKVATGLGEITRYERAVLEGAARAALATGAPITTHTEDGQLGDAQQALLTASGLPAHRIIIGHSCGSSDHAYHMKIAGAGSYLGFDRFGIENMQPDDVRVSSLLKLLDAGAGAKIVVSHDTVWCWRGTPLPPNPLWEPTHFTRRIIPKLRAGGATEAQIEALLVDNPRRFFSGEA
jgi:phosphotriesterase-related protein